VSGGGVSRARVLILTWEYPPIVEGGLARHVRKLSEQLVRDGVDVHVLTRGDRERFRLPGETLVPRARLRRRYRASRADSGSSRRASRAAA
jgi:glycogen synthase